VVMTTKYIQEKKKERALSGLSSMGKRWRVYRAVYSRGISIERQKGETKTALKMEKVACGKW
jgi:hypothetical protein